MKIFAWIAGSLIAVVVAVMILLGWANLYLVGK